MVGHGHPSVDPAQRVLVVALGLLLRRSGRTVVLLARLVFDLLDLGHLLRRSGGTVRRRASAGRYRRRGDRLGYVLRIAGESGVLAVAAGGRIGQEHEARPGPALQGHPSGWGRPSPPVPAPPLGVALEQ